VSDRLAPPTGELRVVEDVPSAFRAVVGQLCDELLENSAFSLRLALSGGTTARACYEELARDEDIAWEAVECFLGDERCVPPADVDANQRMIRQALVDRVPVKVFHPMDCERVDDYDDLVGRSLPLDLVHLGLGPDGHTASLFPGSRALESPPGRFVVHNLDPSGRNPHERLTLTFEAIERCRLVVFTVSGEAKHEALHRVLSGEPLPAARVRAGRVLWLCDREALGEDLGRVP
jgi:6-phosphogluconolactonase